MSPFDLVLMIIGALLTLVGVYLFASGKMTDKASKVEAFGIKLDVTNPSLILILAGVGLMLAPRILPEQLRPEPSPPGQSEVAEKRPSPSPAEPKAPSRENSAERVAPSEPAAAEKAPASVPPSVAKAAPPLPQPSRQVGLAEAPKPARPVLSPAVKPPTAPSSPATEPIPAAAVPAHTAPPPAPTYLVAARGVPNSGKGFWENEKESAYSLKLAQRGMERLRRVVRDAKVETLGDPAAVAPLMDDQTTRQRRCASGGFNTLAVFTVAQPTVVISRVESAYWPEMTLLIHDCGDGTSRREVRQLSPRNADRFPFESDLVDHLDRAFRDRL